MADTVASMLSVAVMVCTPETLKATEKVTLPPTRTSGPAAAAGSVLVMVTGSEDPVIIFPLKSTALTVTLNALPTVCGVGVPILPVGVPGALVSPGIKTCSATATDLFRAKNVLLVDGKSVMATIAWMLVYTSYIVMGTTGLFVMASQVMGSSKLVAASKV